MKILAITRTSPFHGIGGFEDHVRTLYAGLVAKGHSITVLTTAHPQDNILTSTLDGVTYQFLQGTTPGKYSDNWWSESLISARNLLSQGSFDLLHSQSYGASNIFKSGLCRQHRIASAVSFHGTSFDEYKTKNNLTRYEWKPLIQSVDYLRNFLEWKHHVRRFDTPCLTQADCVIATSNEQRMIFETVYRVPSERITTVFNGMSVDQFFPTIKPQHFFEQFDLKDAFIIGCLARLEPDKGVQYVIREFPSILHLIPSAKLVIVGSGSYQAHLQKLVHKLRLENSVVFVGKVPFESVSEALNLFDIFVNLTIRQNGYDLTMVEAMACEKPVIASQIGSHPTLISHDKTGFLIPLNNFSSFASLVLRLYQDPTYRNQIGKNARASILSSFTDTTMIEQTEACFNTLVNQHAITT